MLLSSLGTLEKRLAPRGINVKWIEFQAGPQLLEGLSVGVIDASAIGDPFLEAAKWQSYARLLVQTNSAATFSGGRPMTARPFRTMIGRCKRMGCFANASYN